MKKFVKYKSLSKRPQLIKGENITYPGVHTDGDIFLMDEKDIEAGNARAEQIRKTGGNVPNPFELATVADIKRHPIVRKNYTDAQLADYVAKGELIGEARPEIVEDVAEKRVVKKEKV